MKNGGRGRGGREIIVFLLLFLLPFFSFFIMVLILPLLFHNGSLRLALPSPLLFSPLLSSLLSAIHSPKSGAEGGKGGREE